MREDLVERIRDEIESAITEHCRGGDLRMTARIAAERIAALAEKAGAEPIGRLTIEHFRGSRAMENVEFEYTGQLEPGTYHVYAAPPSQPVAMPDGWVAVPREPTEEMIIAACDVEYCEQGITRGMLRAAIAAAPAGEGVPRG